MKKSFLFLALFLFAATNLLRADDELVQFNFKTTAATSGNYAGELKGGATLTQYGKVGVLDLGTSGGSFQFNDAVKNFVSTLSGDYTISLNLYIPSTADLSGGKKLVWNFSNNDGTAYWVFRSKEKSMDIAPADGSDAQSVVTTIDLPTNEWFNITYFHKGTSGRLFVNGKSTRSSVTLHPSDLGTPTLGGLGLGLNGADGSIRGARYADFRIYNYAFTSLSDLKSAISDIQAYEDSVAAEQQAVQDSIEVAAIMKTFTLGDVSALTNDIDLPTRYKSRVTIKWTTSDPTVITDEGKISRPAYGHPTAHAMLTAYMSGGRAKDTLTFEVGVLPELSDEQCVAYDASQLLTDAHLNNIYESITLPTVGTEGSVIFWESSDPDWLTNEGRVLQLPQGEKKYVTLTATIIKGDVRETRTFNVCLHEQEPYTNYLFVYFPSNSDENLYYAISSDGYNYTPLNNGQAFLKADTCTVMGGLRDPHILRGEDGWFYMTATDMVCANGWNSNRGLVLFKSRDLIHWGHASVHFPTRYAETTYANVTRVWAPETIWDKEAQKYMVYYSILTSDKTAIYDKVYYNYANADFTDLEDEPTYFYDRGSATIDMDIVYNESDSLYHAFYKNEGTGGICKVTTPHLTADKGKAPGSQWSSPSGTLQQTTENVEGAGVFKLINKDSWILMYDCYSNKHYQFCSSTDLENFTFVKNTTTSGAFTPRHGTVIPITAAEAEALLQAFPIDDQKAAITGTANSHVDANNFLISGNSIFVPVSPDADITNFDPQFYGTFGVSITPEGPQDFSNGAIKYTAVLGENKITYTVSVEKDGNPIIPDFHADPEVLFSKKTGRFYVYPTTDGYDGWGGYTFDVFSSPDLLHFTNEGTILNLAAGKDVSWSAGNAWAPCIEEKWIDGKWRYFFYFSGNNSSLNKKTLGVATADTPIGPFKAAASPLFTSSVAGQMIDSDVFTDPVSGQTYYYYGNGKLCYRLLSDDMLSVVGSEYNITPTGGTLQDYAYREAPYVFYRNGTYYFLWSVDDTGSTNYHVAYGTSTSPTGPIQVADDPIVIIQDPSQQIYGTGHNSIINVPGTDDWYIVYHRINKNYLNNGPGIHREVCIDKLSFAADGKIQPVTPTRQGIEAVKIPNVIEMITGVNSPSADYSEAVRTTYYTLNGVSLGTNAPTTSGIYIRRELLSNGQVRSMKIVK